MLRVCKQDGLFEQKNCVNVSVFNEYDEHKLSQLVSTPVSLDLWEKIQLFSGSASPMSSLQIQIQFKFNLKFFMQLVDHFLFMMRL